MSPIVRLTRKETFSACHRLHSPHLTDAENEMVYGKCNNPNGHGHNYTVEITLKGPVEAKTGMVMNITDLKEYIDAAIMKPLDHKNLDLDVEHFKKVPSTTENLAVYIWENLKFRMPKPELLFEVKLYETDKNSVVYRGHHQNGLQSRMERRISEKCIANLSSDSES